MDERESEDVLLAMARRDISRIELRRVNAIEARENAIRALHRVLGSQWGESHEVIVTASDLADALTEIAELRRQIKK